VNTTYRPTEKPFPEVDKWVALASFALLPFSLIISGATFDLLWSWFIVPVFHLPELTLVASIGVQIVINYLNPTPVAEAKDLTWKGLYIALIRSVSKVLMYLTIAGVLHLFFPIR